MAVRRVIVRTIPKPGSDQPPQVIGQMVDDGQSEPYGTTPAAQDMLRSGPREQFERYYGGYSNGFTFETLPDVAIEHPEQWAQFVSGLHGRGGGPRETVQEFAARMRAA